jgi:hypothetical protein
VRDENPALMIFIHDLYLYFCLETKVYKSSRRESSAKNWNALLKFPNSHGSLGSASVLSKSHAQTVDFLTDYDFHLYFCLETKVCKSSRQESSAKNFNVLLKFPNSHGLSGSSSVLSKSNAQTVEIF